MKTLSLSLVILPLFVLWMADLPAGELESSVILDSDTVLPLLPCRGLVVLRNRGNSNLELRFSMAGYVQVSRDGGESWFYPIPAKLSNSGGANPSPPPPKNQILPPGESVELGHFVLDLHYLSDGKVVPIFSWDIAAVMIKPKPQLYGFACDSIVKDINISEPTGDDALALEWLRNDVELAGMFSERALWKSRSGDSAVGRLRDFISEYGNTTYGAYARLGMAIIDIESGDREKVANGFSSLRALGTDGPVEIRARSWLHAAEKAGFGTPDGGRFLKFARDSAVSQYDRIIIGKLLGDNINDNDINEHGFGRHFCEALRHPRNPSSLDVFIRSLKDANVTVRLRAVTAILEYDNPASAVDPLIEALKDENESVRSAAALVLGRIGDARAVEPLVRTLKGDAEFPPHNRMAAGALAELGDRRAVPALSELLNEQNPALRLEAVKALGTLANKDAAPLLRGIALTDDDEDVREAASKSLGKIGNAPEINSLGDADWRARQHAARLMGASGDSRYVKSLVNSLRDENSTVRTAVAEALGVIADKLATEQLIESLADEEAEVRAAAVTALGNIGDERIIRPVIGLLKDRDWRVRVRVVSVLAKIGGDKVVEPIVSALSDPRLEVRRLAAAVLEDIRDQRAVQALKIYNQQNPSP